MNSSIDTADRQFRLSWHRGARLSQLNRNLLSFGVSQLRLACSAERLITVTAERSTCKRKLARAVAMRPMRHDRNRSRRIEHDMRCKPGNGAACLEQGACVPTGHWMRMRIFDYVAKPVQGGNTPASWLAGQRCMLPRRHLTTSTPFIPGCNTQM